MYIFNKRKRLLKIPTTFFEKKNEGDGILLSIGQFWLYIAIGGRNFTGVRNYHGLPDKILQDTDCIKTTHCEPNNVA